MQTKSRRRKTVMTHHQVVDITALATLGEQFPLRLMQLGFHLMQVIDDMGRDQYRYVIPPVCEVPAGPFLMGSDPQHDAQASDKETPQCHLHLDMFQIGTYPVTVAEYACAVATGAVQEPSSRRNVTWQEQLHHPDHPVVCITRRQARAYATWLAQVTRAPWRLPAETEWEKAARGTDGRIYPWGDQWDKTRANTNDGGPGTTTPVGTYAENGDASPFGVHDMAGNVEEWTSSFYQEHPCHDQAKKPLSPYALCVLRGGSWYSSPRFVRTAFRLREESASFLWIYGIRLVLGATNSGG